MIRKALDTFGHTLQRFCLLGGILVVGSSPGWAQTFSGPTQVMVNADGSFQYDATFTAGADVFVLAADMIDGSDNTDVSPLIGDYFCNATLQPGESSSYHVSGNLLDITSTGKVIISVSPCSGDTPFLETTILPPSLLMMSEELEKLVNQSAAGVWRRPGHQQAFLRKAQKIKRLVVRNKPCNLDTAMDLLMNDLMPRADGQDARHCWVIEPTYQQGLYKHLTTFVKLLDKAIQEQPTCHQ